MGYQERVSTGRYEMTIDVEPEASLDVKDDNGLTALHRAAGLGMRRRSRGCWIVVLTQPP